MYTLQKADSSEAQSCYLILDDGRKFQREQGFVQWADDYPNLDSVNDEIKNGKAFLLKVHGEAAGYMYIDFDGDNDYADIEGDWITKGPYVAVHRMAFRKKFRGKGLTGIAFALIGDLCANKNVISIRMDTDFKNTRMQHVLEKNAFKRCGIISYDDGKRYAYEKII